MNDKVASEKTTSNPLGSTLGIIEAQAMGGHPICVHGLTADGGCTCTKGDKCPSAGKHPTASAWTVATMTDRDLQKVEAGTRNLGWAFDSTWFAIDADGAEGMATLRLWDEAGMTEGGLRVRTGGGGMHVYMKVPGNWSGPLPSNTVKKAGAGIDIRGEGGQVLLPPSKHKSGRDYEWDSLEPARTASIPLMMLLCGAESKDAATDDSKFGGDVEFVQDSPADVLAAAKFMGAVDDDEANGDSACYVLAAHLRDMGLSESAAVSVMFQSRWNTEQCDPPWGEEELRVKVENAYKYAKGVAGAKSETARSLAGNESVLDAYYGVLKGKWFDDVNRRYAFATVGAKGFVVEHGSEGWELLNPFTFQQKLAGVQVWAKDGKGKPVLKPMADQWLRSIGGKRRTYSRIGVWPRLTDAPTDALNIWVGFPDWSVGANGAGGCDVFLAHVQRNVCGGDVALYEWTLDWMAHMVQRPWEVVGVALMLTSRESGRGKSLFADYLEAMVGDRQCFKSNSPKGIVGEFNRHLEGKVLVVGEEAFFSGDHRAADRLKSLITDRKLTIEQKGVDVRQTTNLMRLVCTSNRDTPVEVNAYGDRRWQFYHMNKDDKDADGAEFWDGLVSEMENGGPAALARLLLQRRITHNVRTPFTDVSADVRVASLDKHEAWLVENIMDRWVGLVPQGDKLRDGEIVYAGSGQVLCVGGAGGGAAGGQIMWRLPVLFEEYMRSTRDPFCRERQFSLSAARLMGMESGFLPRAASGGAKVRCSVSGGVPDCIATLKRLGLA